ncbi:Mannose-6-phosphate isomerase, cupin superfamily [Flagellimonas taeanensis]|uniref:Mannose-6-phosphate isomerase, cupin superfamily n=1 Tax=Flagellimonas taeanensis TaxID=1005926 RepID=A0A1M6UVA8_9FLAO|nr:cupin domain-containing protein [Allomuricauda taeanensis]SFC23174.1 Mannose-6-phosphate isomerase, cupin superfamily [Allomuricauda taeanensis]SHK73170.1 Mannose-6-phosphate isomerase, cupin superfamily [Allomuricauda taeanensis]
MESQSKNEQLLILTDVIKVLVSNTETGNQYAIFEENVPPLGGPPPHTHPDEEVFYILEGEFEFIKNDLNHPFKALPGSVVHVGSNEVHTFKNVGKTPGKMIVMLTPGNLLDYFRAIGEPLTKNSDFPDLKKVPDFSQLNVEKVFQNAKAHNVAFIMPDIAKN